MKLPAPVKQFFDADQVPRGPAPVSAFAADASVKDEGKIHVGRREIAQWWQAAKARYQHTAEPQEVLDNEGRTIVRALVSGNFPGSPARLAFSFLLEDGRISQLEIGA
ncbi:nuclear transport factor 2 family protein [Euryhalocaulis caribicus]|uniref:nuclear transport factor 2 family protein n=1 Tax=Euryhalocaulis caribicus TaxID=1161401 RepID=UPI0003B2E8CE|nr:nuclear transport factor 2 family protein [Euryhalocaulis caribicus]